MQDDGEETIEIIESYEASVRDAIIKGLQSEGINPEDVAGRIVWEAGTARYEHLSPHTMYWLAGETIRHDRKPICLVGPEMSKATGYPNSGRIIKAYYGQWALSFFEDKKLRKEAFYRSYEPYKAI